MLTTDEFYIKRCLQIAKNGIGTTRPNPSVGAVIVVDDVVVGEGFTSEFGGNHAEVNAINAVKDKAVLKKATLYVTLEPCAHFGKTPPCADLIVKHQLKRVVIGCLDSNPKVAGIGVERLQKNGIEVLVGILNDECRKHHKRFFTNQEKKRPYIILKWAETKDGLIAPTTKEKKQPIWISNTYSQQIVHKLRAQEHSILVGTNTVLTDNPKLNVRSWFGENPIRIVLDKSLRLFQNFNVFDKSVKTIIFTEDVNRTSEENLIFESIDFSENIAIQICGVLQKHQIQSLIVEGGAKTLQTFIDANLWDEAHVFIGNTTFQNGVNAPILQVTSVTTQEIMNDTLKIFYND